MRRVLMLFLIFFPPAANLFPVFVGKDGSWVNLLLAVFLMVFNIFVWRKSLYAAWLGLPMRMTGNYWPAGAKLRELLRRPAAQYFQVVMMRALERRLDLLSSMKHSMDIMSSMLLVQAKIPTDPDFMAGRKWRRASPKFEAFLEAYIAGYGYGPKAEIPTALGCWEESGFDDRYLRYMAGVGAVDAVKLSSDDMPLDYAIAMREER